MSCHVYHERRLLQISTVSSLIFALMGIGLGLWMGSLVIVFDGAYSLVSLTLTLISLAASMYIRSPKVSGNSLKVAMLEPAVIALKGSVIMVMCLLSFVSAIDAILAGGRHVNEGIAVVFGVVNVIGCYLTYWHLAKAHKKTKSALVEAESKQWVMDTVISAAVLMGFVVAQILSMTQYGDYAVYADPAMVIIASLYFALVPVKMVWGAITKMRRVYQYHQAVEAN
ncbi:TPA: cation transporter [Photobacterium damselae]